MSGGSCQVYTGVPNGQLYPAGSPLGDRRGEDLLHLLAVVQSRLGKKEEALASFDRAIGVNPDHAEALSNRGATLHDVGRFDEALANFERAIGLRADYAKAHYNRGITLHRLGRLDEALSRPPV